MKELEKAEREVNAKEGKREMMKKAEIIKLLQEKKEKERTKRR